MKKKRSQRGSSHASKNPYERPELWANGTLAFYLQKNHGSLHGYNVEKYMPFHERMTFEAQRQNRL